jgi:N utilization substance protein B
MANRHLSRSIILQSLFEWDFTGKPENLKAIIDRNTVEFAPGHSDAEFIYAIAELVQRKLTIIDDILTKAAPEWPLEKISNVDRNILRMGLAELLFGDREQVPPKVAT